jgi:flagellar hook-basal body complex protein FliE
MQIDMVTNPESIDPHQVAIAQTKAELALGFTKAIVTRMVNGFKELESMR